MDNISPKAEPVVWATLVGLVIAALASYGLNITPELKDMLIVAVPMLIAMVVARQSVYAPDTAAGIANQQYRAGLIDASQPDLPSPPAN